MSLRITGQSSGPVKLSKKQRESQSGITIQLLDNAACIQFESLDPCQYDICMKEGTSKVESDKAHQSLLRLIRPQTARKGDGPWSDSSGGMKTQATVH